MIIILLVVLAVFLLLILTEFLWRISNVHPEYARKFVHIVVGSFVAFWPLFLNQTEILGLSIAFVLTVIAAHQFNLFPAIRSVNRSTWGEVFFALAVGMLAYVAHSGWIYLVALLHMSLADGLAATTGIMWGRSSQYKVFGHTKSVVGTATFVIVSMMIFASFSLFTHHAFSLWFIPIGLAAAIIENVAVRGLDNLFVPLLVAVALNLLR
jgi:phytol kinase